jgi:geranylgeranyl diphosphate synthase type I
VEPPSILARYHADLDAYLRNTLTEGRPPLLYRMMRYHLGWEDAQGLPTEAAGGKALRPSLCLWACEALGGDRRKGLATATALELTHNFSLVHDDIQDADRERRHRATVWAVWGEGQAINAGDSLLILARLALLRLVDAGLEPTAVVRACRILDEACLAMIEGQCLDLEFEERAQVSVDEYLEMIEKKSGALFGAALHLGALTAGADPSPEGLGERFGRAGRLLGTAFQVRDDLLGVWGQRDVTGKPQAADIRRRKKTLPLLYAQSAAPAQDGEALVAIYRRETLDDDDVQHVTDILERAGAYDYCQSMARRRLDEALAELSSTAITPTAYCELREVADFLLEREF